MFRKIIGWIFICVAFLIPISIAVTLYGYINVLYAILLTGIIFEFVILGVSLLEKEEK